LGPGRNIIGDDIFPALRKNPTQVTPDEARPADVEAQLERITAAKSAITVISRPNVFPHVRPKGRPRRSFGGSEQICAGCVFTARQSSGEPDGTDTGH